MKKNISINDLKAVIGRLIALNILLAVILGLSLIPSKYTGNALVSIDFVKEYWSLMLLCWLIINVIFTFYGIYLRLKEKKRQQN